MLATPAENPRATLLLAHGSGAPMDSPFMDDIAAHLSGVGISVQRFEFPYMSQRRTGGSKRPPPRADKLCAFYMEAIAQVRATLGVSDVLFIGGKSLGGRVASMVADAARADGLAQGLVCLGYPFHPPKKPDTLRTAHLADIECPTLICQGTRDPLGTYEEVATYALSDAIHVEWIGDGDHDLKPRKRSSFTHEQNMQDVADAIAKFAATL